MTTDVGPSPVRLATVIAIVAVALGIVLALLIVVAVGQSPPPPPDPLAECRVAVLTLRENNLQLQRIISGQLQRLTEFEQAQLNAEKAANAVAAEKLSGSVVAPTK